MAVWDGILQAPDKGKKNGKQWDRLAHKSLKAPRVAEAHSFAPNVHT